MNQATPPDSNPFATRFTRPGAVPFIFPQEDCPQELATRLAEQDGWGEITGPHGSGKSTLLAAIAPSIEQRGRQVVSITLRDGQRKLPPGALSLGSSQPVQVIIDGYEQLSRLNRWRLQWRCRRRGWGLLVTAHESVGLRPLYRTEPNEKTATQIVQYLLRAGETSITAEDVGTAFGQTGGDLREMLFTLYDVYESRLEK